MKKEKNNKKSQIKAIIFDVGGVLALEKDPIRARGRTKGVHEEISKKLGVSLDRWVDNIGENNIGEIYKKAIIGKISEKKFLSFISKTFSKPPLFIKNIFLRAYKTHFKQNTALYYFAFELKKKGYVIAILSDQFPISQQIVMPKNKIRHFNPVIVSCEEGVRKPNPKIYKLMLQKLNFRPKEIVFIDNQEWNLTQARKLGIHTILFKNNKQIFRDLRKLGVEIK